MNNSLVLTERHGKVGLIRLNRPQALNAFNRDLVDVLSQTLAAFDADQGIYTLVLTGSDRAFSVGADIKEMSTLTAVDLFKNDFFRLADALCDLGKPIVAAVSGHVLGGGCEVALACDMIVASETARFALPEVTIGVIPGWGGTQRLTRAVGKALAMEVILNNRVLSATEAEHFGLVNKVSAPGRYLDDALTLAADIAGRSPVLVGLARQAILKADETALAEGLDAERRFFNLAFATQDQKEGLAAFIEKRKAEWQGK